MTFDGGDGDEDELQHESVFMMNPGHHHQPLQQVDQAMRDEILGSLAQASSERERSPRRHGAQEEDGGEEGQDSCLRAVRLQQNRGTSVGRSEVHGSSLLRGTPGSGAGERQSERLERKRNLDSLSGVWASPVLHSGVWGSWTDPTSRTPAEGRGQPAAGEETSERFSRAQQQEDRLRRPGEVFGNQVGEDQAGEGSMGRGPAHEGPQRLQGPFQFDDEHRKSRESRPWPPRQIFNAFGNSVPRRSSQEGQRGSDRLRAGDVPDTRTEDTSSRGSSGRVGVQPTGQPGRQGSVECGDNATRQLSELNTVNETEPEKLETSVSPARNSTMRPTSTSASSMAIGMTSTNYELYEHDKGETGGGMVADELRRSSSFTPGGILSSGSTLRRKRKPIYEPDEDEVVTDKLKPEETAFLVEEVTQYNKALDEIFVSLNAMSPDYKAPTVLELCCEENSGITKAVEARGGRGIRCGLFNGCDLNKKAGFRKVYNLIVDEKPDVLWLALPCGPTSNIQELNMINPESREKIEKKIAQSKRLAAKAVTLMELHRSQGGEIVQEWPRYNKGWRFGSIMAFWKKLDYQEAYVDGCSFGLRAPSGGLIKKPWKLRSTTKRVWRMQSLCQCQEPHVPCEGGTLTKMSALYPAKMCAQVAKMVEEIHYDLVAQAYAVEQTPDCDTDVLKQFTDQEVQTTAMEVLKLHKKLGHPSRQAFLRMLKDRGASLLIRTLASIVHCQDCQEAAIPPSRRAVTLEQATELWEVVQLDNMEVTVGEETFHFQIAIDEASGYGAATFLFKHSAAPGCSRNATSLESIEAFYKGWIQYFGYPKILKLDKEGAHRGRELEEWAESHGLEVEAIPAECHGQIGQAERMIGTLKQKLMTHLRSSDAAPEVAVWAMMGAHNTMSNVAGYTPAQWVFGRNFSDSERLHDGPDLPYWSGMASSARMQHKLQCKMEAEQAHREITLRQKVNMAANTKMPRPVRYEPGALVYYKRYQPPSNKAERSHQRLDIPRRKVARWYGPARVLAVETKVSYDGHVRQPSSNAWIIASGRLKKVSTTQLRHASQRERVVAEGTSQLTLPWTFQDLSQLINKGEYDDEVLTERQLEADARRVRAQWDEELRIERSGIKRQLQPDGLGLTGQAASSQDASRQRMTSPTREQDAEIIDGEDTEIENAEDGEEQDPRHQVPAEWNADDVIHGRDHFPFGANENGPLFQHPQFLQARRRHEMDERPHHVQRQEFLQGGAHYGEKLEDEEYSDYFLDNINFDEYAFAVTLPTPSTEAEWRSIVKDPSRFVAKRVAKGVEVSWQKLSEEQRKAMGEAKQVEINEWVKSRVCRAALGEVPPHRLMKMRWVLVFKATDDPGLVKAKARLVVVGFTDPDLGQDPTRSPTLTRRGRQALLQLCSHRGWEALKADAKAAFLQGKETQQKRQIFGLPVSELQEAMNLKKGQAIQFLKAAYGLTVAPREFYLLVDEIIQHLGLSRLKTDPSIWVLKTLDEQGRPTVHGAVGAHVDDFLLIGGQRDPVWQNFLQKFHESLRWSPWEVGPFNHCGVLLEQDAHGHWHLTQEEFCKGLSQVEEDGKTKELTSNEQHQCRAVLGAAQWRCYQTAPQHCSKLSHLQSMVARGDRSTLKDINKFVREIYNQADTKVTVFNLHANDDDEIVLIGWSDAALANRVDLSSTGGYIIGFANKKMLEKGEAGPVSLVSWSTHKLKRVCRSSLGAEAQALAECEAEMFLIRVLWQELLGKDVNLATPWVTSKKTPAALVIDAKALYDMLMQKDIPHLGARDKHTALEVLGLSQHIEEQDTALRWCNSDQQLSDGMTKVGAQDKILKFLNENQRWNVVYDETFTSAKRVRAAKTADASFSDPCWTDMLKQTAGHVRFSGTGIKSSQPQHIIPGLATGSIAP